MPTDPSITAQLGGLAILVLLVLAATPAVLAFERHLARQRAGIPAGVPVTYRRTREGNLRAICHPSQLPGATR